MENVKFCEDCGNKLHIEAVMCPNCGKQLEKLKTEEEHSNPQIVINNTNTINGVPEKKSS